MKISVINILCLYIMWNVKWCIVMVLFLITDVKHYLFCVNTVSHLHHSNNNSVSVCSRFWHWESPHPPITSHWSLLTYIKHQIFTVSWKLFHITCGVMTWAGTVNTWRKAQQEWKDRKMLILLKTMVSLCLTHEYDMMTLVSLMIIQFDRFRKRYLDGDVVPLVSMTADLAFSTSSSCDGSSIFRTLHGLPTLKIIMTTSHEFSYHTMQ